MANYKETEKGQGLFLTVNLGEQLLPGSFEWTISQFIDNEADLSGFDKSYNNDEKGAPAYEPRIMLKIVLYGYSQGVNTSRKLHAMCREHIIMKALAEDQEPYHTTIGRFIVGNGKAIEKTFTEVLYFCSENKLIGGKMFAIDGCKLPSNASKEWSGTKEELKKKREKIGKLVKKLIAQHREEDSKGSGDRKREEEEQYRERIRRYKEQIKKLDEFERNHEPRKGSRGGEVQSNITDNESGKIQGPHGVIQGYNGIAAADSKKQIIIAADVYGGVYEGEHFPRMLNELEAKMETLCGKAEPLKGKTILGDTGYFSEENLRAAEGKGMRAIIPDQQFRQREEFGGKYGERHGRAVYGARDFRYDKKDDIYTCPCGKKLKYRRITELNGRRGKRYEASGKDCATCVKREACIRGKTAKNRTLYIPVHEDEKNLCERMRNEIDKPAVRKVYGKRMQIIEPVFADITYCKGLNRFTLRTKAKVGIQWLLYCMVHNLSKCMGVMMEQYAV